MSERESLPEIRIVIVDDEKPARTELRQLLALHPQAQVVGEAADVETALALTTEHGPDLILLDIQLAGESGFDFLERVPAPSPHVVFVTAHDQHAVRAFECAALDYLLKPVRPERLAESLARLQRPKPMLPPQSDDLVFLRGAPVPKFVPWRTIRHIEAEGNYTRIHLDDGASCVMLRTVKEWLSLAPAGMFVRIHRKAVVRKSAIREIRALGGKKYEILLQGGLTLPVSRTHFAEIRPAGDGGG